MDYRATSYFWPMDLKKHLLSRVKGAERKALLRDFIGEGRLSDIPASLTLSALTEDERKLQGSIHPRLMGGEYLPDMDEQEVEIARITLQSVTQDVTSVFARREGHHIHYRVVDEYEGMTLSGRKEMTSDQPLSLGELEAFFNGAFDLYEVFDRILENDTVESLLDFASAGSQFYPQLEELYTRRVTSWVKQWRDRLGSDDD